MALLAGWALFLVCASPGTHALQMDTAELSAIGRDIAAGRVFPLAGPNVASGEGGRWAGPLIYYLAALPFLLGGEWTFTIVFFGVLWVGSIGLGWSCARALFGPRVGLLAAALQVTSAQAVIEHRLNFFTALAPLGVLALLRACVAWGAGPSHRSAQPSPGALTWVIVFVGALTQVHVVHVAFVALAFLTWWLWRPALDRRALWLGVAVVLLLQLPWVVEQLTSDARDVRKAWAWVQSRGEREPFDVTAAGRTLVAGLTAPFRLPTDVLIEQGGHPSLLTRGALWVSALLTFCGVAWTPFDRERRRGLALVLTWAAVPLVLFAVARVGVYSFHMVSVLPAFALVAALGLDALTRRLDQMKDVVAGAIILGIGLAQGLLVREIDAQTEVTGRARFPMTMVLSYPDSMWRFPVDIEFPTFNDVARLHRLTAAVGLDLETSGRLHGPLAMQMAHYPPLLPAVTPYGPRPDVDGSHWLLERGEEACREADHREGPWCLSSLVASQDGWRGWSASTERGELPTAFPLTPGRGSLTFSREVLANGALRLWTLGPIATRMDEPTPPTVQVSVSGQPIEPTLERLEAPFWVLAERRYEWGELAGRLEIRVEGVRHVVDLVLEAR